MRTPIFSIILPTFNRQKMLAVAIQSVLDQSFQNWELLIIDDGSTDNTKGHVAQLEDARIHYYYQNNKGKSAARNRGVAEAKGEFICFLDSDDYYLGHHLETLYQEIRKQEFEPAVYRTGMVSAGGEKEDRSVFYDSDLGGHPILFFAKHMVGTNTMCIHRRAFDRHLFDEKFKFFQDTHLLLRVLSDLPFFQIPEYTSIYRIHAGRSSYSLYDQENADELVENNVEAIKDLFDNYKTSLGFHLEAKLRNFMVSRKYMDHAAESLVGGHLKLSLKCFIKAISYDSKMQYWRRYLRYLPKLPLKLLFNYPPSR